MATYDFLARQMADPAAAQKFFAQNREAWCEAFHVDGVRNEHDLYDFIDPAQNKALDQSGKVVLVAGASKGIGRAIAVMFAKARAKALVIWGRNEKQLAEVEEEIGRVHGSTKVLVQRVDVTQEEDVNEAFAKVKETFGAVDVTVFNAGVNIAKENMAEATLDGWWVHWVSYREGLHPVIRLSPVQDRPINSTDAP